MCKDTREEEGGTHEGYCASGETSLKRPSDAEVASAIPVKQSKKTVANPSVVTTAARIVVGASGSKSATSAKKVAAPVRKCHISASRMLAEASSDESHESSPYGQMPRDSLPEAVHGCAETGA
jgi:hypothetical protein